MTEPTIEETEAEVEEFTDELSDEALDRDGTKYCFGTSLPICATRPTRAGN